MSKILRLENLPSLANKLDIGASLQTLPLKVINAFIVERKTTKLF